MDNKLDKNLDAQLRELFHNGLPSAPDNPWFVRKVLNRLPEKLTSHPMVLCVWLFYALGALGGILGWGYAIADTLNNGFTTTTILLAMALPLTMLIGIGILAVPAIKRSL